MVTTMGRTSKPVKGLPGRLLYMGMIFTGVVLVATYTASLASLLTVKTLQVS